MPEGRRISRFLGSFLKLHAEYNAAPAGPAVGNLLESVVSDPLMRRPVICLLAIVLIAVAIALLPAPVAGLGNEAELWRHRNLGKAFYEMPTTQAQAPAELKKALDLAPDSYRDRLNYGLALLRAGDVATGIAEIEKAQKQDPSLPYTWFNLGIAYKRLGRFEDATKQFERMVQLVPDEPVSHYNLGLLYELGNRPDDGFQQFQIAMKLDPNFVAPRFKMYNYYRLHENEAAARKALAEFQNVKKAQQAAGDSEDVEWCFYAELYDPAQAHPPSRDTSAPAEVKFEDRKLAGTVDPMATASRTCWSGPERAYGCTAREPTPWRTRG